MLIRWGQEISGVIFTNFHMIILYSFIRPRLLNGHLMAKQKLKNLQPKPLKLKLKSFFRFKFFFLKISEICHFCGTSRIVWKCSSSEIHLEDQNHRHHSVVLIDIKSLQNRLLKVGYVPATSAGLSRLLFFAAAINSSIEANKADGTRH